MVKDASEVRLYSQPKRKYIQLVDGGITDNIGVRSVLDMVLKAELDRVFKVETDLGNAVAYLTPK